MKLKVKQLKIRKMVYLVVLRNGSRTTEKFNCLKSAVDYVVNSDFAAYSKVYDKSGNVLYDGFFGF